MSFAAKRISELTSLASVVSGDFFVVVDVSDTAAGTTKKVTLADLTTAISSLIDGSTLTNLNASNLSSGTVNDARLSSNVTLQGNTFNGASQLVRLDSSTRLPAVNGSQITNLNAGQLLSGTIPDARLSSQVTMQTNTFNVAGALVQLNGSSELPVCSGVNLTNLNASNLGSGTVPDARLGANVVLRTATVLAVNTAGIRPLATADASNLIVVGHSTGTVTILCTNNPQFPVGMSTKVFCNTTQNVDVSADTAVTVYYISSIGGAASIVPSGTLNLSAVRGRVITITCVATNTYLIEGDLL